MKFRSCLGPITERLRERISVVASPKREYTMNLDLRARRATHMMSEYRSASTNYQINECLKFSTNGVPQCVWLSNSTPSSRSEPENWLRAKAISSHCSGRAVIMLFQSSASENSFFLLTSYYFLHPLLMTIWSNTCCTCLYRLEDLQERSRDFFLRRTDPDGDTP